MCFVSHNISVAKNPYVMSDIELDGLVEHIYLFMYDANSLYSTVMAGPMPSSIPILLPTKVFNNNNNNVHDFLKSWTEKKKKKCLGKFDEDVVLAVNAHLDDSDLMNYKRLLEESINYLFVVDIEVPAELHDTFNDFPPLFEKRALEGPSELSPYSQKVHTGYDHKIDYKGSRLINDLKPKRNFLVIADLLKWYLDHGLIVTAVHATYVWCESPWAKDFFTDCATKRKNASTNTQKDIIKLVMNSLYGKMIQNPLKQNTVRIEEPKNIRKVIKRHGLIGSPEIIEGADLYMLTVASGKYVAREAAYFGFAVLQQSKLLMMRTYYDVLCPRWKRDKFGMKFMYSDTDSMLIELKCPSSYDPYVAMSDPEDVEFAALFDRSEYKGWMSRFLNKDNEKQLGCFKDDTQYPISKFVAIAPKCYSASIVTDEDRLRVEMKNRAKGVPKRLVKGLNVGYFEDKLDQAQGIGQKKINITITPRDKFTAHAFQSDCHAVSIAEKVKVGIEALDVKRYWKDDFSSFAFGHHRIPIMSALTSM